MIMLAGASGYVGQAFARALHNRNIPYVALSRQQHHYSDFDSLIRLLEKRRPWLLINAAGYTGKPNVDACEMARTETLQGNVALPLTISHACRCTGTPWAHISSGCIYNGAFVADNQHWRLETNLTIPEVRRIVDEKPTALRGFKESDVPNFTFRHAPCSFYSGSKALAEEVLRDDPQVYVWRLRIPFDHRDHPRNYLTKLQTYPKVYENLNSLSHLDDFVNTCIDLWSVKAPFGVYNVTNPGYVYTTQVTELISQKLRLNRPFAFWKSDAAFYASAAQTPRSNCILDTSKLAAAGVVMRPVGDALAAALDQWCTPRLD